MRSLIAVLLLTTAGCGGSEFAEEERPLLPGTYAFHVERLASRVELNPETLKAGAISVNGEIVMTEEKAGPNPTFNETLLVDLAEGDDLDIGFTEGGEWRYGYGWSYPVGDGTIRQLLSGNVGEHMFLRFAVERVE